MASADLFPTLVSLQQRRRGPPWFPCCAMRQNTVRQARQQRSGMERRAGALWEGEEEVLEVGRKAVSAVQV